MSRRLRWPAGRVPPAQLHVDEFSELFDPSEFEHQRQVILRAWEHRHTYPLLKKLYAVPNGELRPAQYTQGKDGKVHRYSVVGRKLKAMGVRRGVPDLCLPVARHGYFGLYIEMKRKDGTMRDEQEKWRGWLEEENYCHRVCYGADEAWGVLVWYVSGKPTRVLKE